MQSIVMWVFAIGTVLGSGAAVVQYACMDQSTQQAIAMQATSEGTLREPPTADICQPVRFRIYFREDSAEINAAGRVLISQAVDNVSDCKNVNILIGAPEPHLHSKSTRLEASERSAALLGELEASGLNGEVYVAHEADVLSGPGAYVDPPGAATPDYIVVSIQPGTSQPMAASEAPGVKI